MEHLALKNCSFDFDPDAEPVVPAMALNVETCCRRGIIAKYLRKLTVNNVRMTGIEGEPFDLTEVQEATVCDH